MACSTRCMNSRVEENLADHLREAAKSYYGTACRAFIEAIAPDLDGTVSAIRESVKQFVAEDCPTGSDGQVHRVATRFGLIAAAGDSAIALDILPWPVGMAIQAAGDGLRTWIEARGGAGAAEEAEGIEAVRAFLNAHRLSRFHSPLGKSEAAKEAAEARAAGLRSTRRSTRLNRGSLTSRDTESASGPMSARVHMMTTKTSTSRTRHGRKSRRGSNGLPWRGHAKRGFLVVPKGGRNLSKKERIPGIAKTLRVYHISHTIFEGRDDG